MSKKNRFFNAMDNQVDVPTSNQVYPMPIVPTRRPAQPQAVVKDGHVSLHGFQFTRRGLIAPANATKEQWLDIGEFLFNLEEGIQLLIGDYLVGIEHEYGITFKKLAKATGKSEKTLRNYKTVAGSINLSLRRDNLYFGHYSVIQSMKPKAQKYWIEQASDNGWSVAELRRHIKDEEAGQIPERTMPTLTNARFQKSFNRIMDSIADGKQIADDDIRLIEQWLEQVKVIANLG